MERKYLLQIRTMCGSECASWTEDDSGERVEDAFDSVGEVGDEVYDWFLMFNEMRAAGEYPEDEEFSFEELEVIDAETHEPVDFDLEAYVLQRFKTLGGKYEQSL